MLLCSICYSCARAKRCPRSPLFWNQSLLKKMCAMLPWWPCSVQMVVVLFTACFVVCIHMATAEIASGTITDSSNFGYVASFKCVCNIQLSFCLVFAVLCLATLLNCQISRFVLFWIISMASPGMVISTFCWVKAFRLCRGCRTN